MDGIILEALLKAERIVMFILIIVFLLTFTIGVLYV